MADKRIASWRKNHRETVVVSLKTYSGTELVDVRVHFKDETGELKPSKKGISLSRDQLPTLRDALAKAAASSV